MGLTLLEKGNIRVTHPGQNQADLDKILPIDYIIQFITERLDRFETMADRVMVLQSLVGSGKTTLLPSTIYKIFKAMNKDVIITQPKVLTTREKASELADDNEHYPFLIMGETIGYSTGDFKQPLSSRGILFCTVGSLMVRMQNMDPAAFSSRVGFIIIDEVHERSTELDVALRMLNDYLHSMIGNKDCPFVILTSATFDRDKVARFFEVGPENTIFVEGSATQREMNFLSTPVSNYILAAANKAIELHESNPNDGERGDIMIFCGNPGDIAAVVAILESSKYKKDFALLELHGQTYGDKMKRQISQPLSEFGPAIKRRIVVCNNVAETGLTMGTLKYVIDSGWDKTSEFNPNLDAKILLDKPINRGSAIQRSGRVGRVFPGRYFALFTEDVFRAMDEDKHPGILREDITQAVLSLTPDPTKIPKMLDYLPIDSVRLAQRKIKALGIGKLFNVIRRLPRVSVESAVMVLHGYVFGCSIYDLATMAVFADNCSKVRLMNPKPNFLQIMRDTLGWGLAERLTMCDELIEWVIVERWLASITMLHKSYTKVEKLCEGFGLSLTALIENFRNRDNLVEALIRLGLPVNEHPQTRFTPLEISRLKKCINAGFRANRLVWRDGHYETLCGIKIAMPKILNFNEQAKDFKNAKITVAEQPRTVLYTSLLVKRSTSKSWNLYSGYVENASIMDGYV